MYLYCIYLGLEVPIQEAPSRHMYMLYRYMDPSGLGCRVQGVVRSRLGLRLVGFRLEIEVFLEFAV